MGKPWIGVDLDGTLAFYDGWKGPGHIGDPVPAMVEKVKAKLAEGMTIKIFTARASGRGAMTSIPIIAAWTKKHIGVELEVTCFKDFDMVELWDDRARQVLFNLGEFGYNCPCLHGKPR